METGLKINPETLQEYQKRLAAQFKERPASLNRKLSSLRQFTKWAGNEGYLVDTPQSRSPKHLGKVIVLLIVILTILGLSRFITISIPSKNPLSKLPVLKVTEPQTIIAGSSSWIIRFQGKLSSANGQPIQESARVVFKLYKEEEDGSPLWTSKTWPLEPNPQGEFTAPLGDTTRGDYELPSNYFFQEKELFLGVEVNGQQVPERMRVSTADAAANSYLLQDYPPGLEAGPLTIPVINEDGTLVLAAQNPSIKAVSGTLGISADSLSLFTPDASDGSITLNPDGKGVVNLLFEGKAPIGGDGFLNAKNANQTSGALIYGEVANNATGYRLIELVSGSTPATRFSVDAQGNTFVAGQLKAQSGQLTNDLNLVSGNLKTAGVVRLTNAGRLASITGYYQDSGKFEIDQGAPDIAKITKSGVTASADSLTITMDETNQTASNYDTLVLKRLGGGPTAYALYLAAGNALFEGTLEVKKGLTASENLDVKGSTTLGDATSDTITANARFASSLIPAASDSYNLGSSSLKWANLYLSGEIAAGGDVTITGDLAVNGGDLTTTATTFNLLNSTTTTLNIGGAATTLSIGASTGTTTVNNALSVNGRATFSQAPTQAHTGTWAIGSSTWNQANATIYINPASATADSNLIGAAVAGSVVFSLDAEGDIFARNLVLTGSTSTGTTTIAGDLAVEGNTTLGDATTDTLTLNPATLTWQGGNKTIDLTGAATRTLTLLNSTASQVADLDLSDGSLKVGGTTRINNSGNATFVDLTLSGTTTWTLAAGGQLVVDAATNDNTTTTGVINFDVDSATTDNIGLSLDYQSQAGAAALTQYASKIDVTIDTNATYDNTVYGQYIGMTQTDTGATAWGLYVTGEDKNYFSGSVGIGTTNPAYKLDVSGSLGIGGTAYFASNIGIGTSAPAAHLEISKSNPELRLTDTTSSKYARITKANTSNKLFLYNQVSVPGSSTTLDLQVLASANDVERYMSGTADITSDWYGSRRGTLDWYNSAARFTGITIPAGATITSSYLTITAQGNDPGTGTVRINGEKAASPAQYQSSNADYDNRTRTTNYADWSPPATILDTAYNSPSINSVVQELVDAYGPYDNGTMAFFWTGQSGTPNDGFGAYSYNSSSIKAGKLHIEYTPAATTQEVTVAASEDGGTAGEYGIQTFGDSSGRTVLQGATQRFFIGSNEKMRLDASGNLGVGTTNPAYKLDISTSTANDRGLNIAHTGATGTNYGIYSSVTGAATTNYGGYFVSTGATTDYGLAVAALTGATSTGLDIGALSGTTANKGINIGNISGATSTDYGINLGTLTGGTGSSGYQINAGNITAIASGTWGGINLGTITPTTGTTTYGINIGNTLAGAGTATYGINIGTNASTATTNYGVKIGAISGVGTNNYGLYVDTVSGAGTGNYAAIFAGGNVGIGTTAPGSALQVNGNITPGTTDQDLGTTSLRWDLLANTINADSTVTLTGLGTGVDNTVLILDSSNNVTTDEIDSRVWGTTLVDYSGTGNANYLAKFSDDETILKSIMYETGSQIGVGKTNPGYQLDLSSSLGVGGTAWFGSNVGIGTTGPNAKLNIQNSGNTESFRVFTDTGTRPADTAAIKIFDQQLTTDSNNWSSTMVIQGANSASQTAPLLSLYSYGASPQTGIYMDHGGSGPAIDIAKTGSGYGLIVRSGSVGIGTTGPGAPLEVRGASGGVVYISTASGPNTALWFREGTTNKAVVGVGDDGNIFSGASADSFSIRAEGDLHLGGTGDNLTMTIKSGSVGIGTTGPGAKLEIASGHLKISSAGYGILLPGSISTDAQINFKNSGSISDIYAKFPLATQTFSLRPAANGKLELYSDVGAGIDVMTWDTAGSVGIGTTSPGYKLDIANGDINLGTTGNKIYFSSDKYLYEGAGEALTYRLHTAQSDPSFILEDQGGTATVKFRLNGNSWLNGGSVGIGTTNPGDTLHVKGGLCVQNTTACPASSAGQINYDTGASLFDIAEEYKTSESVEAAEVVVANRSVAESVRKSSTPYENALLGIVSTSPNIVLSSGMSSLGGRPGPDKPDTAVIALAGRVPVKVSTENGPIAIGDPLTSSSTPGVAMKATKAGPIVGKALEAFDGQQCNNGTREQCKIIAFVNVSWYDPDVYLTDTGDLTIAKSEILSTKSEINSNDQNSKFQIVDAAGKIIERVGAFSEAAIANLKAGLIQTQDLIADNVTISNKLTSPVVETESIELKNQNSNIKITTQNSKLEIHGSTTTFGDLLVGGNATIAGTLQSDKIATNNITIENDATISGTLYADEIITRKGTFGELLAASVSAETIAQANLTEIQSRLAKLESTDQTMNNNELLSNNASNSEQITATESAFLADAPNWQLTNPTGDLKITSDVRITGKTNLAQTIVAGPLSQDGSLIIDQGNSINVTTGTLYLQNLGFGGVDILAGKVVIDVNGNVQIAGNLAVGGEVSAAKLTLNSPSTSSGFGQLLEIKDSTGEVLASIDASGSAQFAQVNTKQLVIASDYSATQSGVLAQIQTNATSGIGIFPAGQTEFTVFNQKVNDNTLIYITPVSNTQNKVLYVSAKKAGEFFKVAIDTPIESEIKFNWWIIN